MDILVFSASRKTAEHFRLQRRNSHFSVPRFLPREELKSSISQAPPGTLFYLDVSGLDEKDLYRKLRLLSKNENIFFAVLDPTGLIKDVAGIFHIGAVDYVNRSALQEGITSKRLNKIYNFLQTSRKELLKEARQIQTGIFGHHWISSGNTWPDVVPGKEQTFGFMFIELDGKEEMEKSYDRTNLGIALSSFRRYIESSVRLFNGRIWIWSTFGGLVLFPFNLKECALVQCGFRIMLFKHLYDIEESQFPNLISFRMASLIGNTVYSKDDTGHIVSDSLNSIFHLGQHFVKPGNFCVTEEALHFARPVFKDYFLEEEKFEGRRIFRMRHLVYSGFNNMG